MGWFWGTSSEDVDKNPNDPLRDLDPSLRDFLKKESPVKYDTSKAPTPCPPPPVPQSAAQSSNSKPTALGIGVAEEYASNVPDQSLFKDGRYAHLWKTYESQNDIENANKTDQEKIQDVLEGYKHRKTQIGKAALENCALEQWDIEECFQKGGVRAKMTMCRAENKKFERCYTMQAKLLKALGYLSTYDRPPEVDEEIQMHADTLYHRMLVQEKEIESAKAEGRPIPTFPPLLSSRGNFSRIVPGPNDGQIKPEDLPAKVQASLKERLAGLSNEERELEERAIKAELKAGEEVAANLGGIMKKQDEERRIRKEQGKETIGDKISSMFKF